MILDHLLEIVPAGMQRNVVRVLLFVALIAGAAVAGVGWVNEQARQLIARRMGPVEVQLVEQQAVGEHVFNDLEELRVQLNPKAQRHDIKSIKREALKDYELERQATGDGAAH